MPDVNLREFERMRNGGARTSVRVQPSGTAVAGYQVPLGNRPSIRDVGVVGAPAWTAEQTETWVRTSVSATCPRRLTVFEGGKKDIDKCMEFGDDFNIGTTLDPRKWTIVVGSTVPLSGSSAILSGQIYFRSNSTKCSEGSVYVIYFKHNTWSSAYGVQSGDSMDTIQASSAGIYQSARDGIGSGSNSFTWPAAGVWFKHTLIRKGDGYPWWQINDNAPVCITQSIVYPLNRTLAPFVNGDSGYAEIGYIYVRKYRATGIPVAGTAQPSALNRSMCQSLNLADGLRACCAA